ncbi:MAG: hypothetical protein QOJ64_866 [Acidobacteriota bacterium]|jgi:hypothetical protein|nr:hypothetical protein [Acidobacteriota bacterium]
MGKEIVEAHEVLPPRISSGLHRRMIELTNCTKELYEASRDCFRDASYGFVDIRLAAPGARLLICPQTRQRRIISEK